jgi:pimeloyl-ACP methyl ester carboxylesterase
MPPEMFRAEHDIETPDGRILRVLETGTEGGAAVLAHSGTPGGRLIFREHAEAAVAHGARMLAYDRPGYGGSDPDPGRTVASAAADAAAIADALGIDRFVTWGGSGGGPHALACAALLGDRVAAAATLAGVAPYEAEGLDFLAGMGADNVEEFGLALEGRIALEPYLREATPELLASTPAEFAAVMASLLSPPDRAVFSDELGEFVAASMQDALARTHEGWLEDDLAFTVPWGFALDSITVPILLMQGEQDLMVPPAHGRWLAGRIPGVEARILPDDGHLTLDYRMPEVLDWLLARL